MTFTAMDEKQHRDFVSEAEYNQFGTNITDHEARMLALQSGGSAVANLPIGSVILYYGNLGLLDAGWQVCDGTKGTPDLRDKFIPGAGSTFVVGSQGGAATHQHDQGNTSSDNNHNHSMGSFSTGGPSAYASIAVQSGPTSVTQSHTHYHSGSTTGNNGSHSHNTSKTGASSGLPPFRALYYIMRIA